MSELTNIKIQRNINKITLNKDQIRYIQEDIINLEKENEVLLKKELMETIKVNAQIIPVVEIKNKEVTEEPKVYVNNTKMLYPPYWDSLNSYTHILKLDDGLVVGDCKNNHRNIAISVRNKYSIEFIANQYCIGCVIVAKNPDVAVKIAGNIEKFYSETGLKLEDDYREKTRKSIFTVWMDKTNLEDITMFEVYHKFHINTVNKLHRLLNKIIN